MTATDDRTTRPSRPGVRARPGAPAGQGAEQARARPVRWKPLVAWSALFLVAHLAGELTSLRGSGPLVSPAAGVAVAWLATRRFRADVAVDGVVLIVLSAASALVAGATWAEAVGTAAGLLVQTTVAVVVIAWLAPALWSSYRLEKLRVGDLWALISGGVLGALLGQGIGAVWTNGWDGWRNQAVLVDAAACLIGLVLVGTAALVVHHQVLDRSGRRGAGRALLDALGYRATRGWWAGTALLVAVSTLCYVLVFALPWGFSYAFAPVLVAVYVGLMHPPLYKALHAATVLTVVAVTFDPLTRIWVGVPAGDSTTAIVQLLLFAVLASGLTISVLTDERRSWGSRLVNAERATRDQMSLVRGVLDRLEDAVGVYAVDRVAPVYQNAASVALLGGPEGSVGLTVTRPDGRLLSFEEMPITRVLAGEQISGEEFVMRSAGSPEGITVLISGTPWPGDWPEGPRRGVVVAHDVTALKRQRDELEAFVGTVAHDLRNPVTVIQGWAEQIVDDPDVAELGSPLLHSGMERISSVAERMHQLIGGLLEWSTAQGRAVEPRPVDLRELVGDVCHSHREANSAETAPRFDIGDLPTVYGDRLLLRQVVDNLVGNAVKYVDPDVTPHVRVEAVRAAEGWVGLRISDNGIGIPEQLRAEVFQGFFRVSEQGAAGTGLGLRICRTIVERHGGTVTVEDAAGGRGTAFVVTLPVDEAVARRAVEASALGGA